MDCKQGLAFLRAAQQDRVTQLGMKLVEFTFFKKAHRRCFALGAHDQPVPGNGEKASALLGHRFRQFILAAKFRLAVDGVAGKGDEAARLAVWRGSVENR